MRKKILVAIPIILIIFLCSYENEVHSDSSGGPISGNKGYTGSAFDGKTCANNNTCHSSTIATELNCISTDIPTTGYAPGVMYSVTVIGTKTSCVRFGFQATTTGVGTLSLSNTTTTQLKGSSKYVTHKSAGTSASGGTKSWSFNWTAPVAGTGDVTFNAVINATNNNGSDSGDDIRTAELIVSEDPNPSTIGITSKDIKSNYVCVFPNPATDKIQISLNNFTSEKVTIYLSDLNGRIVETFLVNKLVSENYSQSFELPLGLNSGVYFVILNSNKTNSVSRIIVK